MVNSKILEKKLAALNGRDYAAYQSLLGEYDFDLYKLTIQQIPKDPYAPPHTGIYRVQVRRGDERIIDLETATKVREVAFADFLSRRFFEAGRKMSGSRRGTGHSGMITINEPGQAILERNSVIITDRVIELRCFLGLPAQGRRIDANLARKMLFEELPAIVDQALLSENIDPAQLNRHVETAEDAEFLRDRLEEMGLVAFVADGSILPRESGASDKPMPGTTAISFASPPEYTLEFDLPHAGRICGMGIPRGVTLITGGGYHGKSTLLKTLEVGVYNHIPQDGRERCATLPGAVKIRAYGGRRIVKTDISPFIRNLPFQKDTTSFSTENASGSTSHAANIIEAIEAGATVLLMDEDTCATNFMIRDTKMQRLVQKEDEPITTFIDKVRQLYAELNVSTILVLGGVGDYFDVADRVIQMINYRPVDATAKAREIAEGFPAKRRVEDQEYPFEIRHRIPVAASIDPLNDHGKFSVFAKESHRIHFGKQVIDVTDLEQLGELSQTKALAFALEYARKYMDGKTTLREVTQRVVKDIEEKGLDVVSRRISGHFAVFRALELAFTLNRLRGFDVVQKQDPPPVGGSV